MTAITKPTEGGPDTDMLPGMGAMVGIDGNAFSIMAWAERRLKQCGASREYIAAYRAEATSSDYDHLLATTVAYATNELDDMDDADEEDEEFTFGDAMSLRFG
jgi:hypothetical protein